MPTIFFACGAELTTDPSTTSHWTSVAGVTRDSAHVRSGSFALKCSSVATPANLRKVIAAGNRNVVVRFSIYVTAVPGALLRIAETSTGRVLYLLTNGKLQLYDVQSTNTLPLNQWVNIDLRYNTTANPHTYDWNINGVAQPSTTSPDVAVDTTSVYIGDTSGGATADWWYDDVAISLVAGDYPLPDAAVTGTGTEVWGATAPVWTTPADTASMSTSPNLQFTSPVSTQDQHFQMQLDTANTFNTGNLRTVDSSLDQTGWTYWNGSTWVALPSGGLPLASSGAEIRYAVSPALSATTWFRRVRAGI